jgi:flagellar protein FliS
MQQYQRAQVETASPTRLVVLLYDGAIRFCSIAQEAMRKRDLETQNTNLIKAQRIIGELMSSLDRESGGEVAANLSRIYSYLMEEMVKANLYDRAGALDPVLEALRALRASWEEIDRTAASAPKAESASTSSRLGDRRV